MRGVAECQNPKINTCERPEKKAFKRSNGAQRESDHFYPEAQLMKEDEVEVEDEDGSEGEEGKPL